MAPSRVLEGELLSQHSAPGQPEDVGAAVVQLGQDAAPVADASWGSVYGICGIEDSPMPGMSNRTTSMPSSDSARGMSISSGAPMPFNISNGGRARSPGRVAVRIRQPMTSRRLIRSRSADSPDGLNTWTLLFSATSVGVRRIGRLVSSRSATEAGDLPVDNVRVSPADQRDLRGRNDHRGSRRENPRYTSAIARRCLPLCDGGVRRSTRLGRA